MPRIDPPRKSRKRWLLLPLAVVALPIAFKLLGIESVNRASTRLGHADASLRTRFYALPPDQLKLQVLEAIPKLSTYGQAWRVMAESDPGVVKCEVPVLVFTDDLEITIEAEPGGSRVDVTSASRVGQGDMGENARHIRQLLSALDKSLEEIGASR